MGQPTAFNYITINGNDYQPVVTLGSVTENSINYKLKIPELRLSLHILYEVVDNVLQMKITSIKEHGITKIRTIGFPENSMVSVANSQRKQHLVSLTYITILKFRTSVGVI